MCLQKVKFVEMTQQNVRFIFTLVNCFSGPGAHGHPTHHPDHDARAVLGGKIYSFPAEALSSRKMLLGFFAGTKLSIKACRKDRTVKSSAARAKAG